MICTDCAMWAANRDDSGSAPDWDAREAAARFIVTGDPVEFSRVSCDACGTHLAGARWDAERDDDAPQGERVASDDLNTWVDFGSPFRVHADGTISHAHEGDEAAVHAPETVYVDEGSDDLDGLSEGWSALRGYTGQHGYRGPIMHPSEQLSGRIADDVLSTPGLYVVVAVETYDEHDDEPAGWAVITRPDAA